MLGKCMPYLIDARDMARRSPESIQASVFIKRI
jgi:hypothetical protein